jgi:cysteine-rich repeat protein
VRAGAIGARLSVVFLLAWALLSAGCSLMMDDLRIVEGECGDGELGVGLEECDDGNTEDGDGCSSSCAVEDGWQCSGEPSDCSPAVGPPGCEACDDDDPCTDDFCTDTGGCIFSYNEAPCDDDDPCTSGDVCSMGACAGEAYPCDDDNVCTDDVCNGDGTCSFENNAAACDDDDPCTRDDVCSEGSCAGEAYDCNDDNVCTDDSCDGEGGCTFSNNTSACDDGDDCTAGDVCYGGDCIAGDPPDSDGDGFVDAACEDGDDCDDSDPDVNPDASEDPLTGSSCCDAVDNDCDGWADVSDSDCEQCVRFVDAGSSAASPDGLAWQDAFASVQEGIDSAYDAATDTAGSCQVWVAEGTYYIYQSAPEDTVQLRAGVRLYGGFDGTETCMAHRAPAGHETVLEGRDSILSSRVYHVVTGSDGASIDGFTITGGNANGSDPHDGGGGMLNSSASPAVSNCVFTGNSAGYGGGMHNDVGSNPTVTGCTFRGNSATYGGGMYNSGNSNPEVKQSGFVNNTASNGGGMYNTGSDPTVVRCDFRGNRASNDGGGMYNTSSAPLLLDDVFGGNHASGDGGAICSVSSSLRVMGSVFEANRAGSNGSAIFNESSSSSTLVNCTLAGNQYGNGSFQGIIRTHGSSSVTLTNTILWNPGYTEIDDGIGCVSSASYSDVRGGHVGTANVNSNPLFAHQPDETRFTSSAGTAGTVEVSSASSYFAVGDVIEVGDDGVPRTVTVVSGSTVTFDTLLASASAANVRVDNWGAGATDLEVDLSLDAGSPCIDAAQDSQASYSDIEGRGRVDDGATDSDAGYADMGAHEYNGPACYFNEVYAGRIYWPGCDARDWSSAEALCAHFGGHLASLTSAGENALVQGLAAGTAWIGASESPGEGNWMWSDGTVWDPGTTNWSASPVQPDDTGALNCAAMYQTPGTWFDESCADSHAFVCEQ